MINQEAVGAAALANPEKASEIKPLKNFSLAEQQAAEYFAEGLAPARVGGLTGLRSVTLESLLKDPEFSILIDSFKARTKEVVIQDKYTRIENAALKNIEDNLQMADIPEAIKVLDVVNKRRAIEISMRTPASNTTNNTINVVNIALPSRLVPGSRETEMHVNSNKEIIAVGERSFAPLPMNSIHNLFEVIKKKARAADRARLSVKAEDF